MTNIINKAIEIFRAAMLEATGVFFVDVRNADEVEISTLSGLYCTVNVGSATIKGV